MSVTGHSPFIFFFFSPQWEKFSVISSLAQKCNTNVFFFRGLNTPIDLPAFIQGFSAAALCLLAFQGELWQVVGLVLAAGTAGTCYTAQAPWAWPGRAWVGGWPPAPAR